MSVLAETHQQRATPAAAPHRPEPGTVRRRGTAFVDWFWAGAYVEPVVPPLRGYPIERR